MLGGYEVLRRLSDGAAAEVYLARNEGTQERVIIEVLRADLSREADVVARFQEEARARRALEHPNVARRVLEGTTTDGRPYVISEAVGDSLASFLTSSGPFRVDALLKIALPLCDALHFLHEKGVIHGNIKPATVYVHPEANGLSPKLVDYGLALMRPGRTIPKVEGSALVEAEYLSPERIKGQRATVTSDIYGMGVLLFEGLTGFPPFTGNDSVVVRRKHLEDAPPTLPPHCDVVAPVIHRCLAKNPVDRYPNAQSLKKALTQALEGTLTGAEIEVQLGDPALDAQTGTGQVLGSYELVEPLGEGAMGRVFLARHIKLGRMVALKLLKPEHAQNRDQLQRFIQEAQAVNKINHEHIVEIYDFVEEAGEAGQARVYCVMEVLRGDTLGRLSKKGPIPLLRAAKIARQIATALDAAHRVGVVHRDIKPDNIFLTAKHGGDFVKVVDFGVAKLRGAEIIRDPVGPAPAEPEAKEDGATSTGVVIGTPAFMPPEQALGKPNDHRVDVYALGVVLYRMVVGKVPFMADTFTALVQKLVEQRAPLLPELSKGGEQVPESLRQLVAQCLEKNPEKRPQVMSEVVVGLDRVIRDLTPVATEPPPRKSFPVLPVAIAAGVVVAVAAAFFALRKPEPVETVQAPIVAQPPTHVKVTVASMPEGATVTDAATGKALGVTPLVFDAPYGTGALKLTLALEGYEPETAEAQTDAANALKLMLRPVKPAETAPPVPPGQQAAADPGARTPRGAGGKGTKSGTSKPAGGGTKSTVPKSGSGKDDTLNPFGN